MVFCFPHLIFFFFFLNRLEILLKFLDRGIFAVFKKKIPVLRSLLKVRICFFLYCVFEQITMPKQHSDANWLFKLK